MVDNINLGIAKAIVSNKVTNEFINESTVNKNNKSFKNLVNIITDSPILMKEYTVIENIENMHIENDVMASKYIDNNMKMFSSFSKEEINEAHNLLKDFITESDVKEIDATKVKLYNSIGSLISESVDSNGSITNIHNSYENLIEYLKENHSTENVDDVLTDLNENIDIDSVIEVAIDKFNTKFSSLNENDISLLNNIIYGSKEDKKELFESLKTENIESLKVTETNGVEDKIHEAIERLNNMDYTEDTVSEGIIKLHNLKQNLN
jgi:hypothetical protein